MGVSIALTRCLSHHCGLSVWGAGNLPPLFTGLQNEKNCIRGFTHGLAIEDPQALGPGLNCSILDYEPDSDAIMR